MPCPRGPITPFLLLYMAASVASDGSRPPDHSLYVFLCPWQKKKDVCKVYVSTVKRNVGVSVGCHGERIRWYDISPEGYTSFKLAKPSGYSSNACHIHALGSVKVHILFKDEKRDAFSGFILMAKADCRHSYQTVTMRAYPFFSIFTFDSNSTFLTVQFPTIHWLDTSVLYPICCGDSACPAAKSPMNSTDAPCAMLTIDSACAEIACAAEKPSPCLHQYTKPVCIPYASKEFSIPCNADKDCSPNSTVRVTLGPYQYWYFTLNSAESHLRNVKVVADRPIFVISGNRNLTWSSSSFGVRNVCATTLAPAKTWGKAYVTPPSWNDYNHFSFIFDQPTLNVTIREGVDGTSRSMNRLLKTGDSLSEIVYGKTSNLLAITADSPFAVYQGFGHHVDAQPPPICLLRLISVEQWPHALTYMTPFLLGHRLHHYVLTDSRPCSVAFSSKKASKSMAMKWLDTAVKVKGKTYIAALVAFPLKGPTTVLVNKLRGKVMTYVVRGVTTPLQLVSFSSPYDFHQRELYPDSCQKTRGASPLQLAGDDVDNDCDGLIDEEALDGLDNDGDGRVDEDNTEPHSDGFWGPWEYFCDQECEGSPKVVRTRTCLNRSAFGNECRGLSIQCNRRECPEKCEYTRVASDKRCVCHQTSGCASCHQSIFKCDSCKPGFMDTEHCRKRCDDGWAGIGCSVKTNRSLHHEGGSVGVRLLLIVFTGLVVAVSSGLFVWMVYVHKHRQDDLRTLEMETDQDEGHDGAAGWEPILTAATDRTDDKAGKRGQETSTRSGEQSAL